MHLSRTIFFCLLWVVTTTDCSGQATAIAPSKSAGVDKETAVAESDSPGPEYVRIRRNERRLAAALETSIVNFGSSSRYPNATVDLVGAIHLGENIYYEQLNQVFTEYEVVLYEAVMPEAAVRRGFRPGGGMGSGRSLSDEDQWTEAKIGLQAISTLQVTMKDGLGLDFQLAAVNYRKNNFVHADMTQEEFEASMAKRGESFSELLVREMGKAAMQQQEKNPFAQQLDLAFSLLSSDRVYRLRRIAAVELSKANEGTAFASSDGTSTIITERNIKALKVLKQQLNAGKKKIAIFYGAGHFPDMEERLVDEFGLQRKSERWLTAWQLRAPKAE